MTKTKIKHSSGRHLSRVFKVNCPSVSLPLCLSVSQYRRLSLFLCLSLSLSLLSLFLSLPLCLYHYVFLQYAVKRTILEHKRETGGDPWDEFFYRAYSINRDNMMLEFVRDGARSREDRVKQALSSQSTKVSKLSDMVRRGGETKRDPSPLMKAIGREALPGHRSSSCCGLSAVDSCK